MHAPPPISSRVTFSLITNSAIRGEPRYMLAFLFTMNTTSQKAGMYRPLRTDQRATHLRDGARQLYLQIKDGPGATLSGNISSWSVRRAPAESTR